MSEPFTTFVCTQCGLSDFPCKHHSGESKELRRAIHWIEKALCEIIHILNRPQSATLVLHAQPELIGGIKMPATIAVGKTASSLFQEWTGPNGTGTVVPNVGAIAYSSDNTAVAVVDPASGVATGVSAGTANIKGVDGTNGLTASDVLTVTGGVAGGAVSATLTLTAL